MAHTLFPTALGTCGLTWNDAGLTGFELPEISGEKTERKAISRTITSADRTPRPAWVRRLVDRVQQHLDGKLQDFSDVPLDWTCVTSFQRAVYQEALAIKPGKLSTYGDLALRIGLNVRTARSVGVALATNPWPLIVPCHRIVSAAGKMTGYSASGGVRTKSRLLVLEGAELLSE